MWDDLQHISEKRYGPILVTLNSPIEPQADKTVGRFQYKHPVLDSGVHIDFLTKLSRGLSHTCKRSQGQMAAIQGRGGASFAGAWLGYGFHEEGFTSGLRAVVDHIDDVSLLFDIRDADRQPKIAGLFHLLEGSEAIGQGVPLALVLSYLQSCFWLLSRSRRPIG